MKNLTIVTGIWDLGRENAGSGFRRPFTHYTDNFVKLLKSDVPMIIYGDRDTENIVKSHRNQDNTEFWYKDVDDFRCMDFYEDIQKIKSDKDWLSQAEWLKNSTQATLDLYNPMVMSKMFMLNDACIRNPHATEHLAWLDGGITSTVHEGYFTHDNVLDKVSPYMDKFFFLSYPYDGNTEIHGFKREGMNKFAGTEFVNYVCRGGFFGGHINSINEANGHYYGTLRETLSEGYMGTEESIFTIMSYQNPDLYKRYMINGDGLVNTFFESVKNSKVTIQKPVIKAKKKKIDIDMNNIKTSLYVISFNSPKQFERLCKSWNTEFMSRTTNILLNNSTDESTTEEYKNLCEKYNFEHVKKDNLGICGGRQWVAEHFNDSDGDFYIFLEDDMLLNDDSFNGKLCECGFSKYIPNLYEKSHQIMIEEGYDFFKFSFKEFYGDNRTQWAWYNVPQQIRFTFWPEYPKLPKIGLDPNAPLAKYNGIKVTDKTPYTDGEVYYCNWPQIVSKEGNKKMFIDVKFASPHEQTWMSYMFQELKKNTISAGIFLASPITHDRFDHYEATERKES